jgi:hypothetical protein
MKLIIQIDKDLEIYLVVIPTKYITIVKSSKQHNDMTYPFGEMQGMSIYTL